MEWSKIYTADKKPTIREIGDYIDTKLWQDFCNFIEETYCALPLVEYSECSMARGFNVKYKKGRKAICTLYPNKGWFTCLLVIGSKEAVEAENLIAVGDPYIRELYNRTNVFNGSRWLMIDITSQAILDNTKALIKIKGKPKKR